MVPAGRRKKQRFRRLPGEVLRANCPSTWAVLVLNVATAAAIGGRGGQGQTPGGAHRPVDRASERPAKSARRFRHPVGEILEFCGGWKKNAKSCWRARWAVRGRLRCAGHERATAASWFSVRRICRSPALHPLRTMRKVCPAGLVPYEMEAFLLSKNVGRAEASA